MMTSDFSHTTTHVLIKDQDSIPSTLRDSTWQALKIDGSDIKFLQPALLEQFRADQTEGRGCTWWRLVFFAGTSSETVLYVFLRDGDTEAGTSCLAKAFWQRVDGADGAPTGSQLQAASRWLRGSCALTRDHYTHDEATGQWTVVDGKGLVAFTKDKTRPGQFERYVILLALSVAYRLRFETLMNALAEKGAGATKLVRLAKEASQFNAQSYFRYPVKLINTQLPGIWERIAKRHQLHAINDELNQQIHALYQILNEENRARENRRWQWIGMLLGAISALQILGLFSEATRQRWWEALVALLGLGG